MAEALAMSAPLCAAAALGDIEGIESACGAGADVNLGTTYDLRTPLHFAAAAGQLAAVQYLVEKKGAQLVGDRFGMLPIHEALSNGHYAVRQYLSEILQVAGANDDDLALRVYALVVRESDLSGGLVQEEVNYFVRELNFHPNYYSLFTPAQISKHVQCLIAAKRVANATRATTISLKVEKERSAFYLNNLKDHSARTSTQNAVASYADQAIRAHRCFSVIGWCSGRSPFAGADDGDRLMLTVVETTNFEIDAGEAAGATDIQLVASTQFVKNKTRIPSMGPVLLERYQRLVEKAVDTYATVIELTALGDNHHYVDDQHGVEDDDFVLHMAYVAASSSNNSAVFQVLRVNGLVPRRYYEEYFANGVVTWALYFSKGTPRATIENAAAMLQFVNMFSPKPGRSQLIWQLALDDHITPSQVVYVLALVKFVYYFFPRDRFVPYYLDLTPQERAGVDELFSFERIYAVLGAHPGFIVKMFAQFEAVALGNEKPRLNTELLEEMRDSVMDDTAYQVLETCLMFNNALRLTNFFKTAPTGIAFRFDGQALLGDRPRGLYPEVPYAIYLVQGRGFFGFHVRFRDIARGGIRLITSRDRSAYDRNAAGLFEENYNLALTQQMKNKDIPEGGSKGTIFLDMDEMGVYSVAAKRASFFRYIDCLLDCMMPAESNLHSHLERAETLFFGPDENTADFMELGALRARARQYPFWKAITTGKSPSLGGVPHDTYGITTCGVHQCVVELLRVLDVPEESITKFQTGGPDGDLGSNEVLVSKDRTIAIVDGSGVAYDPEGLNREELRRLAVRRSPIAHFNVSFLSSADAFIIPITEPGEIRLPDGSLFRSATELRDTFHLSPLARADLFVPCGGRPAAIHKANVRQLFDDGIPRFKYIVEGANLFFTDDARAVMEAAGVHHIKDASANKGGVTSSSMEVFAALAMKPSDHERMMCVSGAGRAPKFYEDYVEEILATVRANAKDEFRAIWEFNKEYGTPKTQLTRILSDKINSICDDIRASISLPKDREVVRRVVQRAVPKNLLAHCGVDAIIDRVPEAYTMALVSAWIGSKYVYSTLGKTNEFSFYTFMNDILQRPASSDSKL
mmetsp:Transcript_53117/g.113935  ORF Transcript_53117/g.113935 Transcript_53117/m.113935 type:complete len:1089 (+) Transcript_53117:41-3307(+)